MSWEKAIPAVQRIQEIEYNIEREVIETIQGLDEIRKFQKRLIESSNKQLFLMLPNIDSTKIESNEEILSNVEELALLPGLEYFILILIIRTAKQTEFKFCSMNKRNIQFRYLEGSLQNSISILIIDNRLSFQENLIKMGVSQLILIVSRRCYHMFLYLMLSRNKVTYINR